MLFILLVDLWLLLEPSILLLFCAFFAILRELCGMDFDFLFNLLSCYLATMMHNGLGILPINNLQQDLVDSLISWHSKKQSVVSRCSTESEYRALADANVELLWLRWLLTDIGVHQQGSHPPSL